MDTKNEDIQKKYDELLKNVAIVYAECTGEALDPNTSPEIVIDKIREFYGTVFMK